MEEGKSFAKFHWYDGWFYRIFIDPFLYPLRREVLNLLPEGGRVLEVGFGTGALSVLASKKAQEVVSLEISPKMVDFARRRAKLEKANNVRFIFEDGIGFLENVDGGMFDVAVVMLAFHEMKREAREKLAKCIKKKVGHLIACDVSSNGLHGLKGVIHGMIEMGAGLEHYVQYKDFLDEGGLPSLLRKAGFSNLNKRHALGKMYEIIDAT